MKVYCDCGNEMKTGKEYDAKQCTICIQKERVALRSGSFLPVRFQSAKTPDPDCPHCGLAQRLGQVTYCVCME